MSYLLTSFYFGENHSFTYHFCNINSYSSGEHFHDFYEYFFVTSGSAIHTCSGKETILNKGDLFLLKPEDSHNFIALPDQYCEWVNIAFFTEYIDNVFGYLGIDKNEILSNEKKNLYLKLSDYSLKEFIRDYEYLSILDKESLEINLYFKKLLLKVIIMLALQSEKNKDKSDRSKLFEILGNIDNIQVLQEGVPALVRLSGLSHGHLCRIMKTHMNTTPSRHITDLRLSYATNLLLHSDLNIQDICCKVGYFSFSHFMRLFKSKYGCTPYQFRNTHK